MIISFASSKGGVGKSTACAAVACALAATSRVLVLDLDHNQTLARWGKKVDPSNLVVEAVERDDFTARMRKVTSERFEHVLIDLAGTREATVLKAIGRSDLVVVPAQASEPDLREALVVVSDIDDVAEAAGRAIPYRILLTKIYPLRTRVTDFSFEEIERHGLDRFTTTLVERSAYREMFLTGKPPSSKNGAGVEVAALVEEIVMLGKRSRKQAA